jgi:hypothetical protein
LECQGKYVGGGDESLQIHLRFLNLKSSCDSGHSATSIGLLTYLLLEKFVYHPNLLFGLTCIPKNEQQNAYSFVWGYGWHKQCDRDDQLYFADNVSNEAVPDSIAIDISADIAESKSTSAVERSFQTFQVRWLYHWYAIGYCLLLLPVPFSRLYLHDHTQNQVLVGAFVGMLISIIWYIGFVRRCGMKIIIGWRQSEWGKWC